MAKKMPAAVLAEESTTDKEMQILTAGDTVKIGEEEIRVKPYSWANTFRLAKPFSIVFGVIASHLNDMQALLDALDGKDKLAQLKLMTDFIGSIDETEDVIQALTDLIVLSAQMDRSRVESLLLDDFIKLSITVYEVNRCFFVQRLAPMMPKKILEKSEK